MSLNLGPPPFSGPRIEANPSVGLAVSASTSSPTSPEVSSEAPSTGSPETSISPSRGSSVAGDGLALGERRGLLLLGQLVLAGPTVVSPSRLSCRPEPPTAFTFFITVTVAPDLHPATAASSEPRIFPFP